MMEAPKARGYLPIDGIAAYDKAVQGLVFGADSAAVKAGRIATVQALGGTGGLKLGADFLKRINPGAKVLISDPSWENHRALFESAGFKVESYPYYDAATRGVDFAGMLGALNAAPAGTIVVLHACCHNPTGYDITPAQWDAGGAAVQGARPGGVPRHGLPGLRRRHRRRRRGDRPVHGRGARLLRRHQLLEELFAVRRARRRAQRGVRVQGRSRPRAEPAQDRDPHQLLQPADPRRPGGGHGADHAALRAMWEEELAGMRVRIKQMRQALQTSSKAAGVKQDMGFITRQKGMFSYSGLNKAQMQRLRSEFGIYGVDSGRICVAALNSKNIDAVVAAIAKVS